MTLSERVEILLVEDNPRDSELARRALRKCDLEAHLMQVKDGQEALDWLLAEGIYAGRNLRQQPKVVFLDIKLPKRSGLEVLKVIRADPRTRHLPVVMMTSSQQDRDVRKAYEEGGNSYLVKPVESEKYFEAIGMAGRYWVYLNTPLQGPVVPEEDASEDDFQERTSGP